MTELDKILPKDRLRLMDLVKEAGVDVSDWANCKGGAVRAAANPKYCYEWSFVEPRKVVVFNLWHNQMEEISGLVITRQLNVRDFANKRTGQEKRRGLEMDKAIQTALKDVLPIRVVVLGGRRRNINRSDEKPSQVSTRLLDPVAWSVTEYDERTGACTLTRGADRYVDQFSIQPESSKLPERRQVSVEIIDRSRLVRSKILLRAKGKCEWCGVAGFLMSNRNIYLETHHVKPLGDGGLDNESNVVALCPNHHREAHYGANRDTMKTKLLARIMCSEPTIA